MFLPLSAMGTATSWISVGSFQPLTSFYMWLTEVALETYFLDYKWNDEHNNSVKFALENVKSSTSYWY